MGYAPVLVLALVGFLFIMRGTAVQHVRGVGGDGIPVGPAEPQFPLSVALRVADTLSRILLERAAADVQIFVLLDAFGTHEIPAERLAAFLTAGLLYAAPTLGSTAAERFLALSIAGSRRTLYITNAYFAPDDTFVGLLTQAARRGVAVRLLVGGRRTDIRVTWWGGARALRAAACHRCPHLRVATFDAACQDLRRGRPLVLDRHDELRQPLAGAQR